MAYMEVDTEEENPNRELLKEKFTFECIDNLGGSVLIEEIIQINKDSTMPEIFNMFKRFLLGCGYSQNIIDEFIKY